MLDLTTEAIRAFLREVQRRVQETSEVLAWVDGEPIYHPSELVPPFLPETRAAQDFERFSKQTQTLATRALRIRRQGMVGTVTWSEVPPETSKVLERLRLRKLAFDMAKPLLANGVAALWPTLREQAPSTVRGPEGGARLQLLTGHLEPLWDEDDVGGQPAGLMQVNGSQDPRSINAVRYDVMIWDFYAETLHIWRNLMNPAHLAGEPDVRLPEAGKVLTMPQVLWTDLSQGGHPLGEFKQQMPTFKRLVAQALQLRRVSQLHGYPNFAMAGRWEAVQEVGPSTIFRTPNADGKVERLPPGDLEQLFEEEDRVQDEMRTSLLLPITTGGEIPSGEALVQANASYNTANDDGSEQLSDLLTEGVKGYLELIGMGQDDLKVTVKPNRELKRVSIAMQVREDFRAGIIDRAIALNELEQFYTTLSTEDMERWLEEAEQMITAPEPSLAEVSGGDQGQGRGAPGGTPSTNGE